MTTKEKILEQIELIKDDLAGIETQVSMPEYGKLGIERGVVDGFARDVIFRAKSIEDLNYEAEAAK